MDYMAAPEPADNAQKKKQVTLMLSYFRPTNAYEVKEISNSTWYKPGDWLTEATVKEIIDKMPNWEIIMAELDFLSKLPLPIVGGL